ncbi:23S rRNA (uracil(1939)-C(5))-methyltransferase RlmD [Aerococcus agrisoli]|uniref:23S rRNA (Uracil(1939)-C(5))-methyltransferase RlmD n=1 Tax=Aerococcus agrisoli TaxID=2487350 RepID=A0A3N4GRG8_9LACT|nr:23S rRNA (uracil(1939)-C(5))-methyltransferase RlmD [Aerococcus agrisoli]RPA65533.1 23S rRNA (uracil(1939)-C(5))-methyltransferase RlmD [Aerococcus agrisoli]
MNVKQKYTTPVQKNDTFEGTIEDLTFQGLGVAKVEGYPIFVENALTGEEGTILVVSVGKKYGYGKMIDLKKASPDRVELVDKVSSQVGTMPLQHMTYQAQLAFKQKQVADALHKFGLDKGRTVHPTVAADQPFNYRNKAQIPIGTNEEGQLYSGFYRKNSHDIIPVEDFKIQLPGIDEAIATIVAILNKHNLKGYNEQHHSGLIRNLVIRKGYYTDQMMVIIVVNGHSLPEEETIVSEIVEALPNVVSIMLNANVKQTNVVMSGQQHILYGADRYEDKMFDLTYEISSKSFFQINTPQAEKLYQLAIRAADLQGDETVIDAYSGIGTITLSLAQKAKTVYGVEVVADAVKMAKNNAAKNAIHNVHFETGQAERVMGEWVKAGVKPNVVVVDPPRKGLDDYFINSTIEANPDKIVYVSCNPTTMARDVAKFVEAGYDFTEVQPLDMFPQTWHVECVVLMSRVEK